MWILALATRPAGVLIAGTASIAAAGIVIAGPGNSADVAGAKVPQSTSFALVTTEWFEPPPPPPVAPPPEVPAAPAPRPTYQQPRVVLPPPPPPAQLRVRYDAPNVVASITNNNGTVGCVYNAIPIAGTAAAVNFQVPQVPFSITGAEEARVPPQGPATGSTFRATISCDNGQSASVDGVY